MESRKNSTSEQYLHGKNRNSDIEKLCEPEGEGDAGMN